MIERVTYKVYASTLLLIMMVGLQKVTAQIDTIPSELQHKKIKITYPLDMLSRSIPKTTTILRKERPIFNVDRLPIFCKIEHKLAKSANINVMMRLGSLDYVNKLEGKH